MKQQALISFFRAATIVLGKELRDSLRDRKSLMMALLYPLIGPLVMGSMLGMMAKVHADKAADALKLPVIGADYAPRLCDFLRQQEVEIIAAPIDPEHAVKEGEFDAVLRIPEDFSAKFRRSQPAQLELIVDKSRQSAQTNIDRARRLLLGYGNQMGRLRLLVRGIDPGVVDAVVVAEHDVATDASRAAMILAMLPFFIISALFMGGFYIATDSCAGELERGSLEPLFINPVRREALMFGKFLAAYTLSLVALGVALAGFALLPHLIDTQALGMNIQLDPSVLLRLYPLFIPLGALASTLQMIVATSSKSYKEAQTQVSLLMMLPMIPGMIQAFVPFKPAAWMFTLPTLGEQILTTRLLRGDSIDPLFVLLSIAVTSLVAGFGLFLSALFFRSERLFGRK